jgi:hypothetical protein
MMITQAIRDANSSREVYLLLSTHLEAVRLGGQMMDPFREIATAPLVSMEDVKQRTLQLFFMLQAVSKSLDDNSRGAVKEALYVFSVVLDRLKSLEGVDIERREPEPVGGCRCESRRVHAMELSEE